jgi:hypothetical protein
VNLGEAAHITAASPGGPRYDQDLSPDERVSADNGIWLCPTCAALIDRDDNRYPEAKLREWKADAEAAAALALEERRSVPTESDGVFLEAQRLMPKLIDEMRADVRSDASELVRELVPLPSRGVIFNSRKGMFEYFEDEHPGLLLQIDWLEEMGVLVDVTPRTTPVYRMTPEFARWLRTSI